MKIGIVCSSGGHLVESLRVLFAFEGNDLFLVTYDHSAIFDFKQSNIKNIYYVRFMGATTIKLIVNMIFSFFQIAMIFLREKPDVIFSTGSEIAVPAFYLGKYIFRAKLIFLESITRVNELSFTGKLIYAISDLFLVQWPVLLNKLDKKAMYKGSML